jgi:DNA-binding IclR family transcriptional regulator
LHGEGVLIVHHVFRPDSSLQILEVGEVLPVHATALGKACLAYLPNEVQQDLIGDEPRKLTGHTLVTRAALKRELNSVRARGYAVEREEAVIGEAGVAAPIFNSRTEPVGAVGIAGPRSRILRRGQEPTIAAAVLEAARGISRDLGAPRWPAAS